MKNNILLLSVLDNCLSLQAETTSIMAKKKEYNDDNPVTMVSEPSVAYMGSVTMPLKASRKGSMSVEAYFNKVRKALDERYENL